MSSPGIIRFEPEGPGNRGLEKITDLSPDDIEQGSPIELAHNYFTSSDGLLTAGVWECTPHRTKPLPYPVDEFMLVLEGSVSIVHEGGHEETFHPGEAFVIPRGLRCAWKQTESIRKYYVILESPSQTIPDKPVSERAIRLTREGTPGVAWERLELPDPSLFEGDPPEQQDNPAFCDSTGRLQAGTWTCTPMRRKALPFLRTELMCLLEGSVTLTDGAGRAHTFRAPDVFLVPYGTLNAWSSSEGVRKYYCSFEPGGAA